MVDRPTGVEVIDSLAPPRARVAAREPTSMCPAYQMSAGFQDGCALVRLASAKRRGGGQPVSPNRTRMGPGCCGVKSTRITARCGAARETKVSIPTEIRFPFLAHSYVVRAVPERMSMVWR